MLETAVCYVAIFGHRATGSAPQFGQNLLSEKITGRSPGPPTAGKHDFQVIQRRQPVILRELNEVPRYAASRKGRYREPCFDHADQAQQTRALVGHAIFNIFPLERADGIGACSTSLCENGD
jgi:hypothetical protein